MQTYPPLVLREWTPPRIYDKSARVKHLLVTILINQSAIATSSWFLGKIIPAAITSINKLTLNIWRTSVRVGWFRA